MIIEPYCSKPDSLRSRLSQLVYHRLNHHLFDSEKIPFARRTDSEMAIILAKLIINRIAYLHTNHLPSPTTLHLYDIGCGKGLLGANLLKYLKTKAPEIYTKIQLHLTDSSKSILDSLRKQKIFQPYRDHLVFDQIDITSPQFPADPFLVICINVFDALPYQQITLVNSKPYEIETQTVLDDKATILDTSTFPPHIIEPENLLHLIKDDQWLSAHLHILPQLLPHLQFSLRQVPLTPTPDLQSLIHHMNPIVPFHYSSNARFGLERLLKQLLPGGFVFISDFGPMSVKDPAYSIQFGRIEPLSVSFFTLIDVANNCGLTVYHTHRPPDFQQDLVIDTLPDTPLNLDTFIPSQQPVVQEVETFLSDIKRQAVPEILKHYHSLSPPAKRDYRLLNDTALYLVRHHAPHEALKFIALLKKYYQHGAGLYYYLVSGAAHELLGASAKAEKYYLQATDIHHPLAYAYLGNFYWQQNRIPEYITTLKKYLQLTHKQDHLHTMLNIAAAHHRLNDDASGYTILRQLVNLAHRIPNLLAAELNALNRAETLLDHHK